MKKELLIHTIPFLLFFALISLVKGFFSLNYWPFFLGGIIGTILPDIDHIIYVYYLRPYELTSQRAIYMVQKGDLLRTWQLLAATRSERTNLILHTALFHIVFVVLGLLVLTSSGSLLGRGIILSLLLHLAIDQVVDYLSTKNINNWTSKLNIILDNTQTIVYLIASFVVILIFGFLL